MKDILKYRLDGVETFDGISMRLAPFLRDLGKSRGLGYVVGRWEFPWLVPDSEANYWLDKHTERIAKRTSMPILSDLDIFSHPDVTSLMARRDVLGNEIPRLRNEIIRLGRASRVYLLWGWQSVKNLDLVLPLVQNNDIEIYDFPQKVNDPLLGPLPEELE